jgi:hypothetical protein
MKDETFVERKFIASLQRALEDVAPEQLEVFAKWFDPADRRPRFHIAPVIGAVGYLRKSPPLYVDVMNKAGEYAAQWCCLELTQFQKKVMNSWVRLGRERLVRRLLRGGIRSIHRDAQMELARDDERLVVTVSNSVFCRTATPSGEGPACVYYSAFFNGLLDCTSEDYASFKESCCRARGDSICQFEAVPKEVGSHKEEVDVEATSVA